MDRNNAIHNRLSNALASYLNKRSTASFKFGYSEKNNHDYEPKVDGWNDYAKHKNNKDSSWIKVNGERELTLGRVININNTLFHINKVMSDNNKSVDDKLIQVREVIRISIQTNNTLSSQYGKSHVSYKANLASGLNWFLAWWHKTWFQSRANTSLETCLDILDTAKGSEAKPAVAGNKQSLFAATVTIVGASAPPAYNDSPEEKSPSCSNA